MESTNIEWADHTFNPWKLCTPVSPGCANCYAAALAKRFGWGEYKKGVPRQRTSAANWKQPLKWNRDAEQKFRAWGTMKQCYGLQDWQLEDRGFSRPLRPRVFCASLADWLDEEVPVEWLADLVELIRITPDLDWLLLTKRPHLWEERIFTAKDKCFYGARPILQAWLDGESPRNVWIGTTVEDQARAAERSPELLKIPARVRFLSVEPMLEPINFDTYFPLSRCPSCGHPEICHGFGRTVGCQHGDGSKKNPICGCRKQRGEVRHDYGDPYENHGIHWAIFGGESGPGARPCNIEWIRHGVGQCRDAGVAPFVKQLGSNAHGSPCGLNENQPMHLKDKKGGGWSEWPEDLRVREFPGGGR